jgi:beta-phosphoglucomutase-like phosphatase (HAD superfamily)
VKNPDILLDLLSAATTVLFDFNGTLSDDEAELEAAYGSALLDMGLPAMPADEYAALLGRSEPDIAAALVEARGRSVEEAADLLARVGEQYATICRANPRVSACSVDLVVQLVEKGWKLGIVTGTLRQLIEPVLWERDISDRFHCVLTIEDVENGKPDPEGFLKAAALAGEPDMNRVLVFEDSPAGVQAAQAAGMTVVGIGPASGAEIAFPSMDEVAEFLLPRIIQPVA